MDTDEKVAAFLSVLDPNDSTTGGGTASAVAGAMAAGLGGMVARLSLNKPGAEPPQFYRERESALYDLSQELFTGGQLDATAFKAVRDAYGLPKESDKEKESRRRAVQSAWVQATEVPLANAEKCTRTLSIVVELEGRSNENAASDLHCAQYLSYVGFLGCLENVDINLPMIKDKSLVEALAQRADTLRASAAEHRARLPAFKVKM